MTRFLLMVFLSLAATAATAAPRTVIYDFELIDTSLGGEMNGTQQSEKTRLATLAPELRAKLAASGKYDVVPLSPEIAASAKASNLQSCGGCDVAMAKKLDADLAMTGTVQKVSASILNVNIYVRDVKTGQLTDAYTADIRNNTDEGWARGLSYLIRNRLLVEKSAQ